MKCRKQMCNKKRRNTTKVCSELIFFKKKCKRNHVTWDRYMGSYVSVRSTRASFSTDISEFHLAGRKLQFYPNLRDNKTKQFY